MLVVGCAKNWTLMSNWCGTELNTLSDTFGYQKIFLYEIPMGVDAIKYYFLSMCVHVFIY